MFYCCLEFHILIVFLVTVPAPFSADGTNFRYKHKTLTKRIILNLPYIGIKPHYWILGGISYKQAENDLFWDTTFTQDICLKPSSPVP